MFLEDIPDIPPAKVKHGVRERFAKVQYFLRRIAFQQEGFLINHNINRGFALCFPRLVFYPRPVRLGMDILLDV